MNGKNNWSWHKQPIGSTKFPAVKSKTFFSTRGPCEVPTRSTIFISVCGWAWTMTDSLPVFPAFSMRRMKLEMEIRIGGSRTLV